MRQAFLLDAVALDDRSVVLRALGRDAICFAINVASANVQARRRAVDGGKLFLALLHSQRRLHKQVGVAVRFRTLQRCSLAARRSLWADASAIGPPLASRRAWLAPRARVAGCGAGRVSVGFLVCCPSDQNTLAVNCGNPLQIGRCWPGSAPIWLKSAQCCWLPRPKLAGVGPMAVEFMQLCPGSIRV